MSFPLSDERKSGFLAPILGSTGTRGFELATPYYFNLAPNYDATVTPRLMTKRGVQLGAQFRYLLRAVRGGEMNVEDLPNDRVTGTNRYALVVEAQPEPRFVGEGLAAYWDLEQGLRRHVFLRISRTASRSRRQTTLPREGGFAYTRGPWRFLAREQAFQTLQDPNAPPVGTPYNRMPQLVAAMREIDWRGLTFAGTGEYVRFRIPRCRPASACTRIRPRRGLARAPRGS